MLLMMIAAACRKPYNPPAITNSPNYLVVEGVISTSADSTIIRLSRTYPLTSNVSKPETNALVSIENDANNTYPLTEVTNGYYSVGGLTLDNSRKYRLRIKTANGSEYLSDFVESKVTPPIDSIGFSFSGNSIQIYANTHDPQNNTHYYRWDYKETWQFHAQFDSQYVTNGDTILPRTPAQQIYTCFSNNTSTTILLGSSAKLSNDVIYQSPLTQIASTSEKIEAEYSILVHQYALTSDAYEFWENLKKNTEQLGSIFDPQPSNINGNIHNVNNASEVVIGYVSASTIQTKRFFIFNTELPNTWLPAYPYTCSQDSEYYVNPKTFSNDVKKFLVPLPPILVPTSAIYLKGSIAPVGYMGSDIDCVDCTIRGTTKRPDFWK